MRLAGPASTRRRGPQKEAPLTCCPDEYRLWVLGLFRWLRLWLSLSGRSVGMHEHSPPRHLPQWRIGEMELAPAGQCA